MSKRFTETGKWKDAWFRRLKPMEKLFFLMLLDECDAAGFWEPDEDLARFLLGASIDLQSSLKALGDRIEVLPSGYWRIVKFIPFQYGVLSNANPCHRGVLKLIQQKTSQAPPKGLQSPIGIGIGIGEGEGEGEGKGGVGGKSPTRQQDGISFQNESKINLGFIQDQSTINLGSIREASGKHLGSNGEATGKQPEPEFTPTPIQIRFNELFKRRNSTRWSKKEIEALKFIEPVDDADFAVVAKWYSAKIAPDADFRRRDLITLLNNWNGEVDRARKFKPATCF